MHFPISKLTLIATAAATIALAGCSTSHPQTAPASSTASAVAPGENCAVNPKSEPMPAAEKFAPAPPNARISVKISGIPSGAVKPGDPPAEVDVTLCNNSSVDYPNVGVTTVLSRCSCAINPSGLPVGRIERFDATTKAWVPLKHPVVTTGMDYLGRFTDEQPLPKGKTVTLKYRVSLDHSMTAGKGSVESTVVVPDSLVEIGMADLPFSVLKDSPKDTPTPRPEVPSERQSVLPFTDLTNPWSVAAGRDGNVYVSQRGGVVKLAAASYAPTVLPVTGVKGLADVAADGAGNVYVADFAGNRVLKLTAGSNVPTALPFTGLDNPQHLAVDSDGTVYVTDSAARVVKLAAGASEQTVLPLNPELRYPAGVAVDDAHNVYIADSRNHRIVKYAAGSNNQTTISISGLDSGRGFAVDSAGDVFVTDEMNRRVLKRPAGSNESIELPFAGLNGPECVSVDGAGNVYVLDSSGFGRIVKLAAG
ncbi:NHL repeat-containing protein [Mycobacterium paraterrae]|uniref:NHL repeat-containing protein n=1 Tax=Mycobacterium paraterrae TaxID=577492 RepID=A0ABY3VMC9_9MYCO|nr:NHL repeat-containing protein [Mycobacterium paraterrae]UMB67834.1 NHL repeat-containing protein [Mycobacterium paraterrae]